MEEKLNEFIDRIEYFVEKDIDTWNREDWSELDRLNTEIFDFCKEQSKKDVKFTESHLEKLRVLKEKVHICVEKLQE